jgi:hypothetical protein
MNVAVREKLLVAERLKKSSKVCISNVIPVFEIMVFPKRIADIVCKVLQNTQLFLELSRKQKN